ncbi:hypothetical protein N7509_008950 [Penicillium cosmopolitanum]|uniref:AB hydrolase-1 domain-containing protein n=1 Tax=Penicillium cosmopolitanum TaxID=1131564 RepID=A0A9W9VNL4_9EURO|nr:uncharacterized protein N7509_008950 [Penicillium cosmopolitanum]KAJ5386409.1 hypothetical protein N7509_008950 [Penicillium cosmopolitanum]
MPTDQPTILFVPGAWHGPDGFDAVRASLSSRNFPTVALALPSIGAEPPSKGLMDDTVFVQSEIKRLVNQGKRIVVVTHSYGGMVGAGAVKGLEYAERRKQGKHGGVIMLVYMAAFVASRGDSLLKMLGGNYLPWMKVQGDYCTSSNEAQTFYHDISLEDQEKWISKLTHTSRAVFEDAVMHEPWHNLPCMYIFCEKDQALPLFVQESMAGLLGDYTQFRCESSHSPFLSMPEKVAEGCELAAKVGVEQCEEK